MPSCATNASPRRFASGPTATTSVTPPNGTAAGDKPTRDLRTVAQRVLHVEREDREKIRYREDEEEVAQHEIADGRLFHEVADRLGQRDPALRLALYLRQEAHRQENVGGLEPRRDEKRRAVAVVDEKPAGNRTEDDAESEHGAERRERAIAIALRSDVCNIRLRNAEVAAADARDSERDEERAEIGCKCERDVAEERHELRDQHDRLASDAVAQRTPDRRGDGRGDGHGG